MAERSLHRPPAAGSACLESLLARPYRNIVIIVGPGTSTILVSVLLKALASKLWQGWKMVRQEVANGCLGKSAWLKQDAPLQEAVAKLCDYYGTANVIKTIRNKFGAHYDPAKSKRQFTGLSTADGFEVLYSDRLINAFYVTSEVAVWSTILDTTDEPEFRRRMKKLVEQVAARSQEFLQLLNLVSRAFINHSVQDLGGTFLPVAESNVDAVSPEDARLPLFIT